MKIVTSEAPGAMSPQGARSEMQMSARDRAIAALMQKQNSQTEVSHPGAQAQERQPVPDATNISPEEMSAVKPAADLSQKHIDDTSAEVKPDESKATEPAKDPLSSHYAKLAKQEKALRARALELKTLEDNIKAQENAIKAKELEYQSKYISKDKLKSDTLATLAEEGLTYEQLTEMALNGPKPEELRLQAQVKALEDKLSKLEQGREEDKKSLVDQQKNSYDQALNQLRVEARQLINTNEEFETIKATNSVGDVVDYIEKTFNEDKVLLSVEEAARHVENYLVEEAMKLTKLKKIQERNKPASSPVPAKSPAEASKEEAPKMKTLTNAAGASRQLSAKERAILAFKGQLTG